MKKIFAVVGVLINPEGKLLVAERPEHTISAGKWEFPGGKIESFEMLATPLKGNCMKNWEFWLSTTHIC